MIKDEVSEILERMREVYPKLVVKDAAITFWFKHCGELYTRQELETAFNDFVAVETGTPTIAAIRAKLDARYGKRIHVSNDKKAPQSTKYTRMDFTMDMLDPRIVTAEMKAYLGGVTLQASSAGWLKRAKEIQEILFSTAVKKWHTGHRPEWKYWRGDNQQPWPHAELPEFDK